MGVDHFCREQAFDLQYINITELIQFVIPLVDQSLCGEDLCFKILRKFVYVTVCNIAGQGE